VTRLAYEHLGIRFNKNINNPAEENQLRFFGEESKE
jgi:hypothetical protein